MITLGLLFIAFIAAAVNPVMSQSEIQSPTENFPHSAFLNTPRTMLLFWKYDSTHVTFEVWGQTTGWIGIGISPNGAMTGADIFVGWVKDAVVQLTDRHGGDTNGFPPQDASQDVELLLGTECNGWTGIKFKRQLAACETTDIEITTDSIRIIWALGSTDPVGSDITSNEYHGNGAAARGSTTLLLLQAPGVHPDPTEATIPIDLLNNAIAVPSIATYYNCRLHQLPTFSSEVHVVKVEPIITSGNEANVHHMLLYQCSYSTPENSANVGTSRQCYTNGGNDFNQCLLVLFAWAIGGTSFNFPPTVGLPLGRSDSPRYLVLETHFDNPNVMSGIIDSSGVRLHYTTSLRHNAAGVMEVGHVVDPYTHLVPPGLDSFASKGECFQDCLNQGLSDGGALSSVNVFGVMLHGHLLAREISLRAISNNIETNIADDRNYDFNYQETRVLSPEVVVNADTTLQVTCTYQSTGRSSFTTGGLGTEQEMCLAYVLYYPKIPVVRCQSKPRQADLYALFGVVTHNQTVNIGAYGTLINIHAEAPAELKGMTLHEIVNAISYNETAGDALSSSISLLTKVQECTATASLSATVPTTASPPTITTPYTRTPAVCDGGAVTSTNVSATTANCISSSAQLPASGFSSTFSVLFASLLAASLLKSL